MVIPDSSLHIFGQSISYYAVFALLGLIAGILVAVLLAKHRQLSRTFVFRMTLCVLAIGFFAQILVTTIPRGLLPFSYLLGLFISFGLFLLVGVIFRKSPFACAEIGLIAVNTFMVFSKLGCFFAGCCHGLLYSGPFAVVYGVNSKADMVGISLFPIQAVESVVRLLFLFLMLWMFYRDSARRFRLPLYLGLMIVAYFWGMLFWAPSGQTVNQFGIPFIYIFNVAGLVITLVFAVCFVLSTRQKKEE